MKTSRHVPALRQEDNETAVTAGSLGRAADASRSDVGREVVAAVTSATVAAETRFLDAVECITMVLDTVIVSFLGAFFAR